MVFGLTLKAIPIVKSTLEESGIPALPGSIGLGLLTRLVDHYLKPFFFLEYDNLCSWCN